MSIQHPAHALLELRVVSVTPHGPIEDLPLFDESSTVTVGCHWDNAFGNPNLPRLLHDVNAVAPFNVELGLNSTDEMCLADFGIVSPTPP